MSILDTLFGQKGPEVSEEYQAFKQRREWERDVFESAMQDWILHSGLAPIMIEQTREEWSSLEGIEQWPPEQFEHYESREFDTRQDKHKEIKEYVNNQDTNERVTQS